jgi:hypothetical protein
MTRRDREELAKLVRRREAVAKTAAKRRAAELVADVEQQLAAVYKSDDVRWRTISAAAQEAIATADRAIAARCRELGIPEQFRPGLCLSWHGRGENATAVRRAELRRVAVSRIAALEQRAREEIERCSLEVQTQLLKAGLETDEARAFLESMPTIDALMPPLPLAEIEAAVPIAGLARSRS